MFSKRIEIFKKASSHYKKSLKFSENIFKMPFLKKSLAFSKKSTAAIPALPQWPARH
jgi:hypothetical protein